MIITKKQNFIFYLLRNLSSLIFNQLKPIALIFSFFIVLLNSLYAQSRISGTVKDVNNIGLKGVTVEVKGKGISKVTDLHGNFEISIPDPEKDVLLFRFLGLKPLEVSVSGRSSIHVVLESSEENLDEVVVVGYGSQSRKLVTTAVSKLDNKVLENVPYANVGAALQGNLPGVRVQTNSGQPGAAPNIIIRGGTSINNHNSSPPIYIIDGVLRSDMNDINASDIKSIQVLKDAAATAIYGAQGSNGIVIVETKSGESGGVKVNYKVDVMHSEVAMKYNLLSGKDEVYFARLGMAATAKLAPTLRPQMDGNVYLGGTGNDLTKSSYNSIQYLSPSNQHKLNEGWQSIPDPLNPDKTLIFSTTDWQSLLFRNAFSNNHNLTISGGGERAKVYLGLGYMNNNGIAIETDYKRISFNLNGELNISERAKIFSRVMYSNQNNTQAPTIDIFRSSLTAPTTNKLYFEDGTLSPGRNINFSNPFYRTSIYEPLNKINDLTIIIGAELGIMPGLSFRPQFSLQHRGTYGRNFTKSYYNGPSTLVISREANAAYNFFNKPQINAVFNYERTFGDLHNLDVVTGFSYLGTSNYGLSARGTNAATDNIPTLNASGTPTLVSGAESEHRLIGYFSRMTYNYKQKYMLNMSLRYDGASNLGHKNKWGIFPGISLGWNLDQEKFWSLFPENLAKVKLRASYGVAGNISGLGYYQSQGEYNTDTKYNNQSGIQMTLLPNADLKWERSKTVDIGTDISLFTSRLNITIDYYNRITDNLLTTLNLPPSSGFPSILTNYGSLENRGIEFEVNANLFNPSKVFQWKIGFNSASVDSKVLKLPDNGIENNRIGGVHVYDPKVGDYVWRGGLQEGQRIGDLYGYRQKSIYATDEEAASGPIDMLIPRTDKKKFGGDVNWEDVDNNGIIDSRDRVYLGNSIPRFNGGFNSEMSFKGISLNVRLDYTKGATVYNETAARLEGNFSGANAISANIKRSWQKQGDITDIPRYYWADQNAQWNVWNGRRNSRFYQKLDFLSLRELTLSYQFEKKLIERLKIRSLALNLTGSNLYYWTKFEGLSPEQSNTDIAYPNPRSFIFGLNIGF